MMKPNKIEALGRKRNAENQAFNTNTAGNRVANQIIPSEVDLEPTRLFDAISVGFENHEAKVLEHFFLLIFKLPLELLTLARVVIGRGRGSR